MPRNRSIKKHKPIILITESRTDASIVRSLIDTLDRKVYLVESGTYQNIASTLRTQYLNYGDAFCYIAVFDADSSDSFVRREKLNMVRFLSKAERHSENIGVFCFRNTIEAELGIKLNNKSSKESLIEALKERAEQMKQSATIKEIQQFIDELKV